MNISFFITWRNTSSSSRKLDEEEEEEEEDEKEEEGEEDSDGSIDTPSFPASRQNDYQIVLHTLTLTLTLLLNENESSLLFRRDYGLWSVKFIKLFKVKGPFFFFWDGFKKRAIFD